MILAGAIGIPPKGDQRAARRQCLIPNPRREQYERHCRGKGRPPPPAMLDVSYRVSGWLLCPRHYPGASGTEQDRRTLPPSEPRPLKWDLRLYQRTALDAWRAVDGDGVVVAPCGAGKTLIGCAALAAVHTPAVVLVHTRDLAAQWIERIGEAMQGVEVGEVRHGKTSATPMSSWRRCRALRGGIGRNSWRSGGAAGSSSSTSATTSRRRPSPV